MMKELEEYRYEREPEIKKLKDEYKGFKTIDGEKVDLLFANIDDTPYEPHTVSQFWNLIKRYNLKKISFHDFRHSSASYLLSKGHSMKAIQELLGHKDIKTTMNLYTYVKKNYG